MHVKNTIKQLKVCPKSTYYLAIVYKIIIVETLLKLKNSNFFSHKPFQSIKR